MLVRQLLHATADIANTTFITTTAISSPTPAPSITTPTPPITTTTAPFITTTDATTNATIKY